MPLLGGGDPSGQDDLGESQGQVMLPGTQDQQGQAECGSVVGG